jgi:hypothetical protein
LHNHVGLAQPLLSLPRKPPKAVEAKKRANAFADISQEGESFVKIGAPWPYGWRNEWSSPYVIPS